MANGGRTPELSIKVAIDPVIDRNKLQGDINKLIPESKPININASVDAEKILKNISEWQAKNDYDVPIVGKLSNANTILNVLKDKEVSLDKINLGTASLNNIKTQIQTQMQAAIDGLDLSKISIVPTADTSKVRIPSTVKQTVQQTVVQDVVQDKKKSQFTKKKSSTISEDKVLEQMANAQAKAVSSEQAERSAAKQKDIIYQNLVDHQAKAAKNANEATANTAKGLSNANRSMADLNAKAEKFEQNWREVVSLIADATNNLADLMVGYYGASKGKTGRGMDVFSAFQEFDAELPDLNTDNQKEYLQKIQSWAKNLKDAASGDFDPSILQQAVHMFAGLADAWGQIDQSKLTDMVTKQGKKNELFSQMQQLQNLFPTSNSNDPFLGAKDSAINYLLDLLGKAAKYYTEVGNAAKQTANNLATANQGFANQEEQLKQTNAELEKAKKNELPVVSSDAKNAPIEAEISTEQISSLKEKIESGINPIAIVLEPAEGTIAQLKEKIEADLGKVDVRINPVETQKTAEEVAQNVQKAVSDESMRLSFDSPELVVNKKPETGLLDKIAPEIKAKDFTPPDETLDDYIQSVGAAAGLQEYFASEVDNANASLGAQSETLKALKKSLDEYTSSIDGISNFAKVEKELERLKKAAAKQQPTQQPTQPPSGQQPSNQPKQPPAGGSNPGGGNNPPSPPIPPNNTPPNNNPGGGNNGGNGDIEKLMSKLYNLINRMTKLENGKDTSDSKGYVNNVFSKGKYQGQLYNRAQELVDDLNAIDPSWNKSKSWKRYEEDIAHTRDNYTTTQVDKGNVDTLKQLNAEYKTNIDLRRELSTIDKNAEPVKYANRHDDLVNSNAEIKRLKNEAKTAGLDTTSATNKFLSQAAELREKLTNKSKDEAQKQQDDYVNSVVKNYGKIEKLQERKISLFKPEQAKDLSKIDDEIKEINKDIAQTYAEAKNSGYDLTQNEDVKSAIKSLRNTKKASKAEFAQNQQDYNADVQAKATKAQQDQWLKATESTISEAEKSYIDAFKKIQKEQEDLNKTSDQQTQNDISSRIAQKQAEMDAAKKVLDSYNSTANGLVQEAWGRINYQTKGSEIQNQLAYENKASKEAAATKKENLDLLEKYNKALNEELKLYKNLRNADPNSNPEDYALKKNLLADQQAKTEELRKQIQKRGLDTTSEYQRYNTRHSEGIAGIDRALSNRNNEARQKANDEADAEVVENLIGLYRQLDKATQNRAKLFKDEDANDLKEADDLINKLRDDIDKLETAAQYSGIDLANNDSYMAAFENSDAVRTKAERDFNANRAKYSEQQTDTLMKEYQNQVNKMQRAGLNRENALSNNLPWKANQFNSQYNEAEDALKRIDDELQDRGLSLEQNYLDLLNKKAQAENVVTEAQNKRLQSQQEQAQAEADAVKVTEDDLAVIQKLNKQLDAIKDRLRNAGGTDSKTYADAVTAQAKLQELQTLLNTELQKPGSNKDTIAVGWANKNGIDNVKSMDEVVRRLTDSISGLNSEASHISSNDSLNRSITKNKTELANLQSQLYDYLKKFPNVESEMADSVMKLRQAMSAPNASDNIGSLKQSFAELRAQAKSLGLETESLIDKFKNLFGQHFSTMITMAALHQMQNALQLIYQNVVQIDTAMAELRKVSNMTASEMEKYMDRAAESAQKLGVSISDIVSSTADWKRLGYSDDDAENLATYSTLLKNVGDQIDDVSTSSSYLISTLQGFGLLAKDAEDVVDKIDAVANTQPVTANDIGEILTRSSAAMSAANNTLEETIALGTAANAVIQDADTVGKVYADVT